MTIPLQLGSIPNAMETLFERFGDRFAPGDVYIVNDPFDGASHTPGHLRRQARPSPTRTLLGFAVTIAHHADVGGRVPGRAPATAPRSSRRACACRGSGSTTSGEPVEAHLRDPPGERAHARASCSATSRAQVAACHIGDRALQELAAPLRRRRGSHRLMGDLLDHTEQLLRREIASWPDGTVELHRLPGLRRDRRLRRADRRRPDRARRRARRRLLRLRADGARRAQLHAVVRRGGRLPHRDGRLARSTSRARPARLRPITVITRPGTVTHVVMPGASSMRGITGYRLSDVMNGALAQLDPAARPGGRRGRSTLAFFTGRNADEQLVYSELVVGTWGGRPVSDGNDGLANPCASMANIPVELAESDWPILIERYGLVPDSGGAGPLPRRARGRAGLARARARHRRARPLRPAGAPALRARRRRSRAPRRRACIVRPTGRLSRCRRCSSGAARSRATSSTTGCPAAAATGTRSSASRRRWRSDVRDEKVSVGRGPRALRRRRRRRRGGRRGGDRGAAGTRRRGDGSAPRSSHPPAATASRIVLGLEPAFPSARALGPAFTVLGAGADNLALHHAVATAEPGDVIVLAVGGEREVAHCGEIVAIAAQKRGVAGHRPRRRDPRPSEIAALGLPVFHLGTSPRGPGKAGPGALGVPVELAACGSSRATSSAPTPTGSRRAAPRRRGGQAAAEALERGSRGSSPRSRAARRPSTSSG